MNNATMKWWQHYSGAVVTIIVHKKQIISKILSKMGIKIRHVKSLILLRFHTYFMAFFFVGIFYNVSLNL